MFYGVAAWVLLQVGDLLFGALGVPPWGLKLLLGMLLLGFPMALVFAWVYELTPEGLKREREIEPGASVTHQTAGKLNVLIAVLLVVAIVLVVADRFFPHGSPTEPGAGGAGTTAPAAAKEDATSVEHQHVAEASIAVLPFVNMSDDKANEYFSDGLTEELLNVLANVPGLRVIARTSSFSYKGKEVKIADVARDLNVDNVLEGSVRKSGNRVRITTQLIRSADSSHLWSQTYDRDLNDIFAVQDEISNEVVDALKLRLLKPSAVAELGGTQVSAAYEAYLRGRAARHEGEGEDTLRAALAAFDEAIRLDPGYARAYAGKADALATSASNAYLPYDSGFLDSRRNVEHALELAPDLPEALLVLSFIQLNVDADPRAATASAERALDLNPGSYDAQFYYSGLESSFGGHDRAIAAARKAVELDPIAPGAYVGLSNVLYFARQYGESESAIRHAMSLAPSRPGGHYYLGLVLLMQGRNDEALAECNQESIGWQRMTCRGLTYARMGNAELTRSEIRDLQKDGGDAASYQFAQMYSLLGDHDEAFRWFAVGRRIHDPGLMGQVYVDPMIDGLRSDPRYDALIQQLGFKSGK
jgi:TolB-like protein/Tfp pilus assembly protein PilF